MCFTSLLFWPEPGMRSVLDAAIEDRLR